MDLRDGTSQIGLRLNLKGGRAHLSLEPPRPTDRIMSFMGRTLLIVDPHDFDRLERARLAIERGPNGKTLTIEPNISEKAG